MPTVIEAAAPVRTSSLRSALTVPVAIAHAGDHAARRFLEFFAAQIRNKNTRMAYYRAVCHYFAWVEHRVGELPDIEPLHVAAYIETLQATAAKPTIRQHLAAIINLGQFAQFLHCPLRCPIFVPLAPALRQ